MMGTKGKIAGSATSEEVLANQKNRENLAIGWNNK
jgi:hypothetical protein